MGLKKGFILFFRVANSKIYVLKKSNGIPISEKRIKSYHFKQFVDSTENIQLTESKLNLIIEWKNYL